MKRKTTPQRRLPSKDSKLTLKLDSILHNDAANRAAELQMTLSEVVRRLLAGFAQADHKAGQRLVIHDTTTNAIITLTGLA